MRKFFYYLLSITVLFFLVSFQHAAAQNTSPYWSLKGNSNATSSTYKLGTTNAYALRLVTKNITRLYISPSAGYVGIGTSSPSKKFHVVGTSLFAGNLTVSSGGLTATNTAGIGVKATGSTYGVYGNATTSSGFGVYGNSSYIGVYGTGGTMGVYGYSSASYGVFGSSSTGNGVYGSGATGVNGNGTTYGVYGYASSSSGNGVTGLGYIGVYGSGTYGLYGVSNTTSGYGIYGTGHIGVYGYSNLGGGDGVHGFAYGASGYGVYGYSAQSLGVYGSTSNTSSYAGFFSGKVYSSGGYTGSDRKLKQDIADMTNAMDIISKLQPKSYTFRQDGNYKLMNLPTGKHYGLIAQDVEQVLPNLVNDTKFETKMARPNAEGVLPSNGNGSETIEFKALNYTELIPIVIKGMQEQEQRIEEQKMLIEKQQQQIDELKNLVSRLADGQNLLTSATTGTLGQNTPNPVRSATRISYHVPSNAGSAQLIVTDNAGKTVKALTLTSSGMVTLNADMLSSGVYNYSLLVDGKIVATKKMTVVR